MEGPEIQFAEATIDNGQFGTRTIRFAVSYTHLTLPTICSV